MTKKIKYTITFLSLLILSLFALTACGGGSSDGKESTRQNVRLKSDLKILPPSGFAAFSNGYFQYEPKAKARFILDIGTNTPGKSDPLSSKLSLGKSNDSNRDYGTFKAIINKKMSNYIRVYHQ